MPLRALTRLLKYGTLLSTGGFVAVIGLQISARLLLTTAPSWTEELARVCFVLAVGSAAGLALRSGDYVRFDFLYTRLGHRGRRRLDLLIEGATVALFAVFAVAAVGFVSLGLDERSPTLRLPMALPFSGMLILGASVLAYAVLRLRQNLRRDAGAGFSESVGSRQQSGTARQPGETTRPRGETPPRR